MSWTHLDAGLAFSASAYALAIDPVTPSTIYAGLAEFSGVQTGGVISMRDQEMADMLRTGKAVDVSAYPKPPE